MCTFQPISLTLTHLQTIVLGTFEMGMDTVPGYQSTLLVHHEACAELCISEPHCCNHQTSLRLAYFLKLASLLFHNIVCSTLGIFRHISLNMTLQTTSKNYMDIEYCSINLYLLSSITMVPCGRPSSSTKRNRNSYLSCSFCTKWQ